MLYYYKYKDSTYFSLSIFFVLLLIAGLLLLKVVLPQMYNWFSINNEVIATRKKIDVIDANIAYINSLEEQDLAQKRTLFVRALPLEKDVQGLLTIISSSALNASVELDDFSLTIGELSPKGAKSNLSSLKLTVSAKGVPTLQRKFIANLQSRLPLVDIANIELNGQNAELTLNIYYKTLPVFKVNDADPIQKISGKFNDIYAILSGWEVNSDNVSNIPVIPTIPGNR